MRTLTPLLLGLVAASFLLGPLAFVGCTRTDPDCDCGIGEPIPACQEECAGTSTASATASADESE